MLGNTAQLVASFRHSVPYVNAHRGKTFVIMLGGEAIESNQYRAILNDVALLHSLGIRIVLVYGARPQIDVELNNQGLAAKFHRDVRVTDEATLSVIRSVCGSLQFDITARLSMGLSNTPMHGTQINLLCGNFVIAQPLGVDQGIDYCLSGRVRRINIAGMQAQLDKGAILLLGPIAVSVTGESFNLTAEEVATQVAIHLKADKMIGFCATQGLIDQEQQRISELFPKAARAYLSSKQFKKTICPSARAFVNASIEACRKGVSRCHLISHQEDGALFQELFTREGIGTQFVTESAEQLRRASIADIGGVLDLIRPLEQDGILVRRSREQLELEIEQFTVIEHDNLIIGCVALYPFTEENIGELACLAVHPEYRDADRGCALLNSIVNQAKIQGLTKIFSLTTRSIHWFLEQGFTLAELDALPTKKQQFYNLQRRSKILMMNL